jgi:hypothetical protein
MIVKTIHRAVLIVVLGLAFPAASFAGFFDVGITVGFAPPPLPVYVQPPCPTSGYIWTPGYWAYSDDESDYYWVPGTWVLAPSRGLLWTPGYWAVADDDYVWHEGYWAPHVGFYGGINYGYGYFGVGFAGGYWRDRDFYYNRAVTNVSNVYITNVYNRTVINNDFHGPRPSFNGGEGVHARPIGTELIAAHEPHRGFTSPQRMQAESARAIPSLLASVNHGRPGIAATPRPGVFPRTGVIQGRGAAASDSGGSSSSGGRSLSLPHLQPASTVVRPAAIQSNNRTAWNQPRMQHPQPSAPLAQPHVQSAQFHAPPPQFHSAPAPAQVHSAPVRWSPPSYGQNPVHQQASLMPQARTSNHEYYSPPRQPFAQASPPHQVSPPRQASPARQAYSQSPRAGAPASPPRPPPSAVQAHDRRRS